MGKRNPLKLMTKEFRTQKAAVDYFMELRQTLDNPIVEGDELFEELKDLYVRYCDCTDWNIDGRIIKSFIVEYEKRFICGEWVQHKCYKVKFSNNEFRPFSIKKAVQAVATLTS